MRVFTTNFKEVSVVAEKTGKCEVCGKPCKRREKFFQTINPFNKNKSGLAKTHSEIMSEVKERAAEWKLRPLMHNKCEQVA